jgi:glycosyltransferase involved in cell wall biosynthesis
LKSVLTPELRVLMISPQFRPLVGGYERAAERLSKAMAAEGVHVVVVTERREREWPAHEPVDGYTIRRLWCVFRPQVHGLTSLASLAWFLLTEGRRFDIWHVHQYGAHAALSVAAGRLFRRPVILKLTSSAAMGIGVTLEKGFAGRLLARLHRQVDACIAGSEETRNEALKFGMPAHRVHLIAGGVDGKQFLPVSQSDRMVARKNVGLDCERLVLFVGRLSAEKNAAGLIEAWSRIDPATRKGSVLAIVGDGPEREHIRELGAREADDVFLAGPRNDVEMWYRAADVYVIPSEFEGLSNTMIEAMATGLPVVSTAVSGSSILVEPPASGLVVAIGDVQGLADAIASLLDNQDERIALGLNARSRFDTNFSLAKQTEKMISLYEQLSGRKVMERDT